MVFLREIHAFLGVCANGAARVPTDTIENSREKYEYTTGIEV